MIACNPIFRLFTQHLTDEFIHFEIDFKQVISNLKMSWQKWKTSSAIVMSLNGIVAENPSDISLNGTTQSISIRKTYQANVKNLTETHL